jgi:hypothetical protein
MKSLLFTVPLKPGKLEAYKKFAAEITGPKREEYTALLKRYGMLSTRVWLQKIGGREYAMVFHEGTDDALERLKNWSLSTHPFDLWFREQLNHCYDGPPDGAHLLFELLPHHHA